MGYISRCFVGLLLICSAGYLRADSLLLSIPNGLSTISNPYDHGDNSVGALFPASPEGLQLYTFDALTQRWKVNQFQFGAWDDSGQILQPHQAAFIRNPSNEFSILFTGNSVSNAPPTIYQGYNFISALPPPELFDDIYKWNPTNQNYVHLTYGFGGWYEVGGGGGNYEPTFGLGQSFMYGRGQSSGASSNWINFNNYIPASGVDAPIRSILSCLGTNLFAQLFGYPGVDPSGVPSALGQPVPVQLRGQQTLGYVAPNGSNLVPISQPPTWTFEIRFWDGRDGSNYPTATAYRSQRFSSSVNGLLYPPNNLTSIPPILGGPLSPFWIVSNQTVIEGGRAEFYMINPEIYHSGFLYQWQRETTSNNWVNIPGATSTNLVIPSVTLADSGRYRLTAVLDSCDCTTLDYNSLTLNVLQFYLLSVTPTDGQISINGTAGTNMSFAIDYSQNLTQWTQLTLVSNALPEWSVLDTNVPLSPQRFYRARILE